MGGIIEMIKSVRRFATKITTNAPAKNFFNGEMHGVFSGQVDRYKGIRLDENLPAQALEFEQKLKASELAYREQGLRAMWLKLNKDNCHLAGSAVNAGGFEFHHTKTDYLMLTKWIDPAEDSKLPGFATHYCGVGGLVLSKDRQRVLFIKE